MNCHPTLHPFHNHGARLNIPCLRFLNWKWGYKTTYHLRWQACSWCKNTKGKLPLFELLRCVILITPQENRMPVTQQTVDTYFWMNKYVNKFHRLDAHVKCSIWILMLDVLSLETMWLLILTDFFSETSFWFKNYEKIPSAVRHIYIYLLMSRVFLNWCFV